MGVTGYSFEIESLVAADKMFKASAFDMPVLAPKLIPKVVKSAHVHGDGGVGSIKEFRLTEDMSYTYVKERIDVLDAENFVLKYSLVEGGTLGIELKSLTYQIKVDPSVNGGSVFKVAVELETMDGVEYTHEEINKKKEATVGSYKAIEAYLLSHP
ncbi:hypothetical protein AQUCO_04300073v1 [Aquilegia coerulea]|uniref:Bet v I/Major latex protein domain-containing protein n=1 Tax=Aquilegia coerulea TaxID=218851 RepID=A0A2G5CNP2_AQUCA|nr:hypothetical protein AQUCO_04300073v1 [Aquilegia coerulea]